MPAYHRAMAQRATERTELLWSNAGWAAPSAAPGFAQPDLMDWLETADDAALDRLDFGVIAMSQDGIVVAYNAAESRLAGLRAGRVLGRHFFTAVAPCTNNYLIAHRYETEAEIDATIDYVFTLRMNPTKVRLRLLKRAAAPRMYLAVDRR